MEANKILQSDILDILFEGRNKLYGAYQLRRTYNQRLSRALIYTAGLLALVLVGTVLAGSKKRDPVALITTTDVNLGRVEKEIPLPVTPPPAKTPVLNQVAYTKPVIVPNEQVKPDQIIESIPDDAAISSQTIHSVNTDHIIQAPVADSNSTVVLLPVKKNEPEIFTNVEISADFPGGFNAWKRYLEKNLDPETPVNNGAPGGTYTVIVRFVVSVDGSISDVVPETKPGYGMESEAVAIIKKGPKWTPAIQNGRQVNAWRRQPITFVVSEE